MAVRGPTLLFIGREPNGNLAWPQVRRLCQPGRALRTSDAYHGLALLIKIPQLSVVVVAVDHLSNSEMSFFSAARRCRPQLHLLALGQGNELSNPRLAQATWQGATEAVAIERLTGRLSELIAAEPTTVQLSQPKPVAPAATEDAGFQSLLQARTITETKRKAPAAQPSKQQNQQQTQDVVTPQELRVLLGEDVQETDNRKEKKQ